MSNIINDVIKKIREVKTEEEARKILLDNILLINSTEEVASIMASLKEGPNDDYYEFDSENDEDIFELDKGLYKKDMLTKPDYINWIIKYTEKKNQFYDDDFNLTKVDENDEAQMKKLNIFVGLIGDYASENKIETIPNTFGYSYKIKYNDVGLEVGVMHGNGSCCFAQRIPIEDDFIDFSKVMTQTGAKLHANDFITRLNNDEFEKDIDPNPGEPFIPTKENIDREVEKFKKVLDSDLFNTVTGSKPKTLSLKDKPKKED